MLSTNHSPSRRWRATFHGRWRSTLQEQLFPRSRLIRTAGRDGFRKAGANIPRTGPTDCRSNCRGFGIGGRVRRNRTLLTRSASVISPRITSGLFSSESLCTSSNDRPGSVTCAQVSIRDGSSTFHVMGSGASCVVNAVVTLTRRPRRNSGVAVEAARYTAATHRRSPLLNVGVRRNPVSSHGVPPYDAAARVMASMSAGRIVAACAPNTSGAGGTCGASSAATRAADSSFIGNYRIGQTRKAPLKGRPTNYELPATNYELPTTNYQL